MRKVCVALSLVVLATCQALAEEQGRPALPSSADGFPGVAVRPSFPVLLVANYEGSLSEALEESALTEEEQQEFLMDFQATMTVKQAKLELLRVIHQLELVEKKCKGTPIAGEATQLLKLLPQRKDLQPGQPAANTVARHPSATPAEASTVK